MVHEMEKAAWISTVDNMSLVRGLSHSLQQYFDTEAML